MEFHPHVYPQHHIHRTSCEPTADLAGACQHPLADDQSHHPRLGKVAVDSASILQQHITGLAHDMNNLLVVLVGQIELARLECPRHLILTSLLDEMAQTVWMFQRATHQLRLAATSLPPTGEETDVAATLEDLARLIRTILPQDTTLRVHCDPSLPCIAVSRFDLQRVVLNLVLNAADALDVMNAIIVIRARVVEGVACSGPPVVPDAGLTSRLILSVADTGHGMDAEVQAQVLGGDFTTKGRDRGVGLSIVTAITQVYGGTLVVHSNPGVGTTMTISFPISPVKGDIQ